MNFIGKGLQYPIQPDSNNTAIVAEEDRIRANLRFLLSLKYNTVPGMEDVGSELPGILFEKLDDTAFLEDSVTRLLQTYENRVAVDFEVTSTLKGFTSKLNYRIKGLNQKGDIEILNEDG